MLSSRAKPRIFKWWYIKRFKRLQVSFSVFIFNAWSSRINRKQKCKQCQWALFCAENQCIFSCSARQWTHQRFKCTLAVILHSSLVRSVHVVIKLHKMINITARNCTVLTSDFGVQHFCTFRALLCYALLWRCKWYKWITVT